MVTYECENPDLRDRGFIYWRLLSIDPELAKAVIYAERPAISELSYTLDSELLDKLLDNLGSLSSIYYKPPESFIKKMRDCQNLKVQEENENMQEGDELFIPINSQA